MTTFIQQNPPGAYGTEGRIVGSDDFRDLVLSQQWGQGSEGVHTWTEGPSLCPGAALRCA